MPGYTQKEKAVREKRTIEAVKKNYMGLVGKFGTIARCLGTPIVRQGGGYVDSVFLDDPYEDFADCEYEKTMSGQDGPMMFQDKIEDYSGVAHEEGFVFDGLSRGMHMEIKYWHSRHKIEVSYKGYEVYKEVGGELESFAPFPEWEDMITRLYKAAKQKSEEMKILWEANVGTAIETKKRNFWERLRLKWGV